MASPISRQNRFQRGEGKIGVIITLLLLVISVVVAIKAIPVKIVDTEFKDFMDEQAKFAGDRKADSIHKAILHRAKELQIPLDKKNLRVERPRDRVRIECTYTVTLEFPLGFTYDWTFNHHIDRTVFVI